MSRTKILEEIQKNVELLSTTGLAEYTPETFTIGDGTQGDHDLAPQGHFPWILRDGTRSTDRFHTILYRCISGADL